MNFLLIGALPPPLGGTAVSFQLLIEELKTSYPSICWDVLNVGLYRTPRQFLKLLVTTLKKVRRSNNVSIHLGIGALSSYGLFIAVCCLLFGRPYSVRRFGGQLICEQPWFKRKLLSFVFRCSKVVFCQTKAQLEEVNNRYNAVAVWFPTSRQAVEVNANRSQKCKNFVYIGQIKRDKGVLILSEIFSKCESDSDLNLSIYGPLFDGIVETDITNERVSYGGLLEPQDVYDTMEKFDCIVLPTFYAGEGYPGVLVEAMQMGLPIITTLWKSIPELVGNAALLVEPKSTEQLANAIQRLNSDDCLLTEMRRRSSSRAKIFSIDKQADLFIESIGLKY